MKTAAAQTEAATFDYQASAVKIARQGARRLAKLVQRDGRFVYRYDREAKKIYPQYNVLRHCGAVWSMLDVVRVTGADQEVTAAALRAARHMRENFIKPFGDRMCVVDGAKIKLGGAGLTLLALAEWHRVAPNAELVVTARAIGRYILDQRTEDGDDLHHGRSYPDGELYDFRSNYYTGEALFGLLRLYRMTGEDLWLDPAFHLLATLGRRDYGVKERSHWMLYALDAADEIRPLPENRAYAGRIAEYMLHDQNYRLRNMSTPVACVSEALIAFMRLASRAPSEALSPTTAQCERAVMENLAMQLKSFRRNGEFMAGPERRDVRIDYIQHNISAFSAFGSFPGPAA